MIPEPAEHPAIKLFDPRHRWADVGGAVIPTLIVPSTSRRACGAPVEPIPILESDVFKFKSPASMFKARDWVLARSTLVAETNDRLPLNVEFPITCNVEDGAVVPIPKRD